MFVLIRWQICNDEVDAAMMRCRSDSMAGVEGEGHLLAAVQGIHIHYDDISSVSLNEGVH